MKYAELQVTSNFSFLRGGSHPEELAAHAAGLNYTAIAITDRNSLAGIVRAHVAAKKLGLKFIPACRLDLLDGPSLLAYPTDREAYGRLSALLTLGNLRAEKGECHLYKADVYAHKQGIIFIIVPPDALNTRFDFDVGFKAAVAEYKKIFGTSLYIAAIRSYTGDDAKRLFRLAQLNVPMAATGDVHYHEAGRRELQDVLTCIREKCTIHHAGYKLHSNAERYLKPVEELHRLFRTYPEAIDNALKIAKSCTFSLDTLKYIEPEEAIVDGMEPMERLIKFTWDGARNRYGEKVPKKVRDQIDFELAFLEKRKLAPYFLRVYKYTRKAEELGILYQGRGSAANSTVCYCLSITAVDPMKSRLLFSRFMSDARDEWPDIDVDFEHERREEIIQYIYADYGRERAAIVATVTQERHRGAIRDVGKAMGLSEDTIKRIGGAIWDFSEEGFDEKRLREQGLNIEDPLIYKVLELTTQLMGFPRQLGQHTGGFVITDGLLSDLCPVMNARMEERTQLEWNKDDLEALGILKVDVLGLGMLTMIRKAFDLAKQHYGLNLTLANIPQDDPKVYEMISHADTVGVFQIESRAQMSMLPRLKPKCFYDLVIEVAIVRPGPIQGDMVHPYLRRRDGIDPVAFPSKELEEILGRTLGVPLFQEQAMEIAIVAAGFTPAEADELRRSMATFKAKGLVSSFRKKLIDGMVAKGYQENFAARIFKQLEGFGSYGFPESHAASFALLVYVSSWLKCYYPDVFCAALLNSQPMGFYQPAQIVIDAKNHGTKVLPVDVNLSAWDNTIEEPGTVRLGFRQVKGLREEDMVQLIHARHLHYHRVDQIPVQLAALEKLADADAFRSMGLDRRQALWQVSALADKPIALFEGKPEPEAQVSLPLMTTGEHVVQDYASTGLSLKKHPVALVRHKLDQFQIIPISRLSELKNGDDADITGMITVRQRPGTAKGVFFMTLEDETGNANIVVWAKHFDEFRSELIQSRLLRVRGKVQIEGEVIHVVLRSCQNLNGLLRGLTPADNDDLPILSLARGDETTKPVADERNTPVDKRLPKEVFYKGRNFR
jgi:error-prone DNA polymerase